MNSLIESEREFHNRRFAEGDDREAQTKYYWAIAPHGKRFWDEVTSNSVNADVLEYGCSTGDRSAKISELARSINAIDISDVAIEHAKQSHRQPNIKFHVMDAMNMDFPDESFDLIFGSGIVHHLDTEQSMREIARTLRPGGVAVFWEPLGLNPLINLYRYFTPSVRTPDEHPFLPRDYRIMKAHFKNMHAEFFGLSSLAAVPLRATRMGGALRSVLSGVDAALLSIPALRMMAWYSLIVLKK